MKRVLPMVLAACGGAQPAPIANRPPPAPPPPAAKPEARAELPPASEWGGFLRGTIRVSAVVNAKRGTAIFVVAKPAQGGVPLAVDRLTWNGADLPFELDESKAMVAGSLTGDVTIYARYDTDGDALTKQPGDFTGTIHATVPASDLVIVIDTPIK